MSQQGIKISIEIVTQNLEVQPGKIQTVVFKIKNTSPDSLYLTPNITLPKDFKVISEINNLSLIPEALQIFIISFNVPAKYPAGDYDFSVKLVSTANSNNAFAEVKSVIKVKEETIFTLELADAPEFVKAGDQIKATYVVRNIGNTARTVSFNAFNCSVEGPQKADLQPGGSSKITVTSETLHDIASVNRKYFYLEAKSGGISSGQVYGFVNVIPLNVNEDDLYHRFPIKVTSRYVARGREGSYQAGFQFEASGNGSIDPDGKHKIDFLARGPNRFDMSLLGLYDEYYISYSNDIFNLKGGDASYSLTPLTEYARYGTGFEHNLKVTKHSQAGLFYVVPRFYKNIKAEYGAYAKVDFLKNYNIGFYYLHKIMPGLKQDIDLYSVTANLQPFQRTVIELEASKGSKGMTSDDAYRINLNSQISKVAISAFYFHTGKNYPGYYTNSNFYSGNLNYNMSNWLSVGISGRQDFMNAELDTLFSTAPLTKQLQGLLNIRLTKQLLFRTYIRQYERQDRSPLEKFHFKTRSINFAVNERKNKFGFNLEGEFGKTQNFLLSDGTNNEKNTFSGIGNFNYQPSQKLYLQAFLSYSNVNSFISGEQNDWIYGFNLSANLLKNIKANLQLQNTYSIEDSYQNRDLFQFNLEYRFLKMHTISLNSFYTLFQNVLNKPEFSFSVNYSIDLGIPLKKVANAGSISGKIINQGVKKVNGIILYIGGRSAITNDNGEFGFKNIKPGTYSLIMDRSALEMMDICDVMTPIEVIVEDNKVTNIEFGLTKAARLTGKFELDKSENKPDDQVDDSQVIGNVIMELTKDNESIRIVSDQNGQFAFPLLRPGKWYLKIFSSGIDKGYNLEKDSFDFDLKSGETKSIVVKVLKKKRNIIFLNNSINLSSDKK